MLLKVCCWASPRFVFFPRLNFFSTAGKVSSVSMILFCTQAGGVSRKRPCSLDQIRAHRVPDWHGRCHDFYKFSFPVCISVALCITKKAQLVHFFNVLLLCPALKHIRTWPDSRSVSMSKWPWILVDLLWLNTQSIKWKKMVTTMTNNHLYSTNIQIFIQDIMRNAFICNLNKN